MKTKLFNLTAVLLISSLAFAQSVPQGINYQGVARDGNGTALTSHSMTLKASIYSDTITNTLQWQELHTITTNDVGIFSIVLGTGFAGVGSLQAAFADIDWNASTHYIKIELDHGSGFMDYGTKALQSVPYSLAAETADEANAVEWTNINNIPADIADGDNVDDADNNATNELQTLTIIGDTLYISSGNNVDLSGYNADIFTNDSNVTSNANGDYANDDFVFGAPAIDYDANTSDGVRMFFDKSTGSFRAGKANNADWDTDSLGQRSFATGYRTKATGDYSTAMGSFTEASGVYSTAMGLSTQATGFYSTAMGFYTAANSHSSLAIGRFNVGGGSGVIWFAADPLFEVGNGTGTYNRNNAFTIYKNGDADVQRTLTATSFVGDGSGLTNLPVVSSTFTTTSNVTSNANGDYANDDFVFGAPTIDYAAITSDGVRMFFDKSTGAFRAGRCDNANWDTDSLGTGSFATGYGTKATGNYSTAMGISTKATGNYSTAMGSNSEASGVYSTAMGSGTDATGSHSFAMGYSTEAFGDFSTAMGYNTEATGSYSTAMGNSTEALGPYSTAMGRETDATGIYSTAMGFYTDATGNFSTAMGVFTEASGGYSTAMGNSTEASGPYSTAMGYNVTALGAGELYNSGNIKGLSFISTSDRRVKQKITPFTGALSKVMLLNPKTYFYNTEAFPRFEAEKDKPQIGFIAQEVEAIFPEMVTTDGDEFGLKGVRYGQLTAVLVQAIKEQQEMIKELQEENKNFKNRITILEDK